MGRYTLVIPVLLVLGMFAVADCAPQATITVSQAQIPPVPAGAARVWFWRGWDAPSGQNFVYGATPEVYANGAPVGDLPASTSFFRDFAPGTYTFMVEPYGLPTAQATTLQLAAGTQSYLEADWVPSWEFGYPEQDFSFAPNTFAIFPASSQVSQSYLPNLTYLGQR